MRFADDLRDAHDELIAKPRLTVIMWSNAYPSNIPIIEHGCDLHAL